MYFSKNKNYFRFIIWFLTVALVTFGFGLSILWQAIQPHANLLSLASDQIILSFILIVCLVIILAIIAARYFRLSDNDLFAEQTSEIFKIINIFEKSLDTLSEINKDNADKISLLVTKVKQYQSTIKVNHRADVDIKNSIKRIGDKIDKTAQNTSIIDNLVKDSEQKSKSALDGLMSVKQLSTANQKLYFALDEYTEKVQIIAQRVESMADLARYLSLNATIEASKTTNSEEFSSLVNQIRQLNSVSQQAAISITGLTGDMQRQLKQTQQTSNNKLNETEKNITTVSQAINFLTKISNQTKQICKDIKIIDQESKDVRRAAQQIDDIIVDHGKGTQNLSKDIRQVSEAMKKQVYTVRILNRSFNSLQRVASRLNFLVKSK
ncbi:methyl-accepting chemotaxis protein [bacterium]|jgi:methyl-accepting chemotaxis protein|nr:methyl-accepting chemotaxis protein [bacterium]